jgi:hypothetical protein
MAIPAAAEIARGGHEESGGGASMQPPPDEPCPLAPAFAAPPSGLLPDDPPAAPPAPPAPPGDAPAVQTDWFQI